MPSPDWFDRQLKAIRQPPWWFWEQATRHGGPIIGLVGRLKVTGSISPALLAGPLLLAPNHIGNFDTFAFAVAARRVGVLPSFLAKKAIMATPVFGRLLERAGALTVDPSGPDAALSMQLVGTALDHGAHVVVYPEGRVSLDPQLWPERGKTGLARLALQSGVPVIPVSQWGAHQVVAYQGQSAQLRSAVSAIWRQPALQVHFGEPVDLSGLSATTPGDAVRARDRITAAITRGLGPLRAGDTDSFTRDRTRPIAAKATARYPGGQVPEAASVELPVSDETGGSGPRRTPSPPPGLSGSS